MTHLTPFSIGISGARRIALVWCFVALLAPLVLHPPRARGQADRVQSVADRAVAAGADRTTVQSIVDRATRSGLTAESTIDLLQPAVRLAEQGLPATPVLNKSLEGLAKGVPPARMTPVLNRLQTYTEQAGAVVSSWLDRPDVQTMMGEDGSVDASVRDRFVVNVAQSQQQGVDIRTVQSLLDALPTETSQRPIPSQRIVVALSVLPDLPGARQGTQSTRRLLTAALNANYTPEDLRQLPAALESARRTSQRPADVLARGTAQAISNGAPATDVLRGLFQGAVPGGPPSGVGADQPGQGPPEAPPGQGKPPTSGDGPPDDPPGRGGDPPGQGGNPPGNGNNGG